MNVILIDDEEVAVNALKRRVEWRKYGVDEVYVAYSAKQAREIFREKKIDVMFSDIEMPQCNGLELLEWVKSYYPEVECVYITCHPEFEYIKKALQLGSADYILKPIDYDELDQVLSNLTERVRHRHRVEAIPPEIMQSAAGKRDEGEKDDVIAAVKRYIRAHIQENIYISDIAGHVFLNEQYLMRTFKKATGVSILEFITNERIWLARELLTNTDRSIKQVADSVGYGNYSYFTKIFKRSTGLTPQAYRREHDRGDKSGGGK